MSAARAMVLRGIFAAANVRSVAFFGASAPVDDFADGWRQLTPETQEGWLRVARLLAVTPPELLVPRDSPLLTNPPGAYATDDALSDDGRKHGGGES